MSTDQKLKFSLDIGKIIIGIIGCWGMFFYAGKLDQKVTDHDARIIRIENWRDQILQANYYNRK